MNNETFYEYLSKLVETGEAEERDDPVGDFALDAEADSFFPRSAKADAEGFAEIVNYLHYSKYVRDIDELTAFMDSWGIYYKAVTGNEWYV